MGLKRAVKGRKLDTWLVYFESLDEPSTVWHPVEVEARDVVDAACQARIRCEMDGGYRVTQIKERA